METVIDAPIPSAKQLEKFEELAWWGEAVMIFSPAFAIIFTLMSLVGLMIGLSHLGMGDWNFFILVLSMPPIFVTLFGGVHELGKKVKQKGNDPRVNYQRSLPNEDWAEVEHWLNLRPQDIDDVAGWIRAQEGNLRHYHLWELRRRAGLARPWTDDEVGKIDYDVWQWWDDQDYETDAPPAWMIEAMLDGKMKAALQGFDIAHATPQVQLASSSARRL